MDVIILILLCWVVVLPAAVVTVLLTASSLARSRAERLRQDLAPVIPLRPYAGARHRHVA